VYGIKVLVFSKGIFVGALWGSTWRVPVKNPNKDRHTDSIFVYFVCPFSNSNILPCEIQDNMPQGNAKVLQTFLRESQVFWEQKTHAIQFFTASRGAPWQPPVRNHQQQRRLYAGTDEAYETRVSQLPQGIHLLLHGLPEAKSDSVDVSFEPIEY